MAEPASIALSAALYIVLGVFALIVVVGAGFAVVQYKKWKQYRFTVLVFRRKVDDEGNEIPVFVGVEKGGNIYDKKWKRWVFHLSRHNVRLGQGEGDDEDREMNIPSIPGPGGRDVVIVEKMGPRKFAVCDPVWFNDRVKLVVSEADMAEALRTYDVNHHAFVKENNAMKGFIVLAVFAVLILVMVAYTLNKMDLLVDVSKNIASAANSIAAAKSSVVPGGVPG